MGKKISVAGGGVVSGSRASYISKSKINDSEQVERKLFSSTETALSRHKATMFLGGNDKPKDGELKELIFSLEKKDFQNFGDTLEEQKEAMQAVVREGLDNLWIELGVKNVRWVAGIHLNTNNPHAHIAFMPDAFDIETNEWRNIPKIPRNWFWRTNGENSKLGEMFERAVINHTKATPPPNVFTKTSDKNIFLPAREFDEKRIEKTLNRLSEINNINPQWTEHLTDNRSMYVSRQGALTFLRRDVEGKITGYIYESGYQPQETKGFFYIGDPKTATKYIIVENPKEALAALELSGHRDLSEVCFVASDKQESPTAFTNFLKERTNEKSIRVIWAIGLNRDGIQEQNNYEELQMSLLENRSDDAPLIEFYGWTPKQGFGRNWSNQLQFRELPGQLNGIIKKLLISDEQNAETDLYETEAYQEKVAATFDHIEVENSADEFIVYEKTSEGRGIEMGRYRQSPEDLVEGKFDLISVKGEPCPEIIVYDEIDAIRAIENLFVQKIEKEFFEAEAQKIENEIEHSSAQLNENSAESETATEVLEEQPARQLSAREITERLKEIPLEDVMSRLGLYLTYDSDRREYNYRDNGTMHKIKVKGALWCDRYDDNRGGRNPLNLVMHVGGQSFSDARAFLLDNFGTEYIPQNTKEKVVLRQEEAKAKQPFVMPEPNENKYQIVSDYLTYERGISNEIVGGMVERGFLFANDFGGVVFVNKDEKEAVKGASWRATRGTKRGDYPGSEKVEAWFYIGDPNLAKKFIVVESPIEAMSYFQINQDSIDLSTTAVISTATNSVPLKLVQLLERNAGAKGELVIAYNNDLRGQDGALFLLEKIGRFSMLKHKTHFENNLIETTDFAGKVLLEIPQTGDWNEDLKAGRELEQNKADVEHIAEEIEAASRPEFPEVDEVFKIEKLEIVSMEGRIYNADGTERIFPVSFDTISAFDKYLQGEKPVNKSYKMDVRFSLSEESSIEQTFLIGEKYPDTFQALLKNEITKLEELKIQEKDSEAVKQIKIEIGGFKYILNAVWKIQNEESKEFAREENPAIREAEEKADFYEPEYIKSIKVSVPQHLSNFGRAEILLARENSQEKSFHVGYRFQIGEKIYEQLPERNQEKFRQGKQSLSVGHEFLREAIYKHWTENGAPQFTKTETTFEPSEDKFLSYLLHKSEISAREFYVGSFEPSFAIKPELTQNEIGLLRKWRELTEENKFYKIEQVFAGEAIEANWKRNLMYKFVSEGLFRTKKDGVHTIVRGLQPFTPEALQQIGKKIFAETLKSNEDVLIGRLQKSLEIYSTRLSDKFLSQDERAFYAGKYADIKTEIEELENRKSEQNNEIVEIALPETTVEVEKDITLGENPEADYDLLAAHPLKGGYDLKAHKINQLFREHYAGEIYNVEGFGFAYRNKIVTVIGMEDESSLQLNFQSEGAKNQGKSQIYQIHNLIGDGILSKEDFVRMIKLNRAHIEIKNELQNLNLHTSYRAQYANDLIFPDSYGFRFESQFSDSEFVLFKNIETDEVTFTEIAAGNGTRPKSDSLNDTQRTFANLADALEHLKTREKLLLAQAKVNETNVEEADITVKTSTNENDDPDFWKLTRKEFETKVLTGEIDFALPGRLSNWKTSDLITNIKNATQREDNAELSRWQRTLDKEINGEHSDAVKRAVNAGNNVPEAVLLGYPNLPIDGMIEKTLNKALIEKHYDFPLIVKQTPNTIGEYDVFFTGKAQNHQYPQYRIYAPYPEFAEWVILKNNYHPDTNPKLNDFEFTEKSLKSFEKFTSFSVSRIIKESNLVQAAKPAMATILPSNQQEGRIEKRIAKLLLTHNLGEEIINSEEFYVRLENKPYMDLHITKDYGTNLIRLTHWYEQNGDLMHDGEMNFRINKGKLSLNQIAVGLYGVPKFGYDRSFANMFSNNLINQGFEQAKLVRTREIENQSEIQVEEIIKETEHIIETQVEQNETEISLQAIAENIQVELNLRFAELSLKNTWVVKPEFGSNIFEISRNNQIDANTIPGYPDFALWETDRAGIWQIAVGEVTPQTREEPEWFDWLEPENKRFDFETALNHLFEAELLPETNRSANRIAPETRYPMALDIEPTGVKKGTISLALEVRELLHEGKTIGNNIAFNKMSELHFGGTRAAGTFDARDAYDALELGVNLYLLDHGKDFIEGSSVDTISEIRDLLRRLPTQTDRTEEQQLFQQFSTVPTESYVAFAATGMIAGDIVLEPSAGTGGLAVWSKMFGIETHVNEVSDRRAGILKILGFQTVSRQDAQFLNDTLPQDIKPTLILMNPPFSATGGRTRNRTIYGAEHITDALLRLQEGGRLVAIVSEGMSFTKPTFTNWWADVMNKYHVKANLGVPGDEYSKYGTNFGNQILVIDKTGATPGKTMQEQLTAIEKGDYKNLESVLEITRKLGDERRLPSVGAANTGIEKRNTDAELKKITAFKGVGEESQLNFYSREPGYELKTVSGEVERIEQKAAINNSNNEKFLNIYVKNEQGIIYMFGIGNRPVDKNAALLFEAVTNGSIKKGDNLIINGYFYQKLEERAVKNLSEFPEQVAKGEKSVRVTGYVFDVLLEGKVKEGHSAEVLNENLIPEIDYDAYQIATSQDRNYIDDENTYSPEEVRADYLNETRNLAQSVINLQKLTETGVFLTKKAETEYKKNLEKLAGNKYDLAMHVQNTGIYFGEKSEEYIKNELSNLNIIVTDDYEIVINKTTKTNEGEKTNDTDQFTRRVGNNDGNNTGFTGIQSGLFESTDNADEFQSANGYGNTNLSNDDGKRRPIVKKNERSESRTPVSTAYPANERTIDGEAKNGVSGNAERSVTAVNETVKKQLLLPEIVELNDEQSATYDREKNRLTEIGFETVKLSNKQIAVKTIPDLSTIEAIELFTELVQKPELIKNYLTNSSNQDDIENLLGVGRNTAKRERIDHLGVVSYKPAKLTNGVDHPGDIVESASMAAVEPPDIKYTPKLDRGIIEKGILSGLQLEAVIYAGQRHEHKLPNGMRAGVFIGDGTGVGKGRELAGITLDNWNQGRKRVLWLSINYDLVPSTERDLKALLADGIPLKSLDKHSIHDNLNASVGDAVLFASYATLIGKGKDEKTRFDQIVKWLGEDGVILFDEGHLAKNAVSFGMSEASQRGEAVVDLQIGSKSNPNWRIVYSSATGATELRNMAYMQRLGLWGEGTGFPGGFGEFHTTIDKGGIGAMEMVARDMKASGMYLSRSLSFRGVDYRQVHHELTPEQIEIYNLSSRAWSSVVIGFDDALRQTNANSRTRAMAYARLWSGQQMFYRQLMTALKVPSVIREVERILQDGSEYTNQQNGEKMTLPAQVIIGVIGTGEARTKDQVSKALQMGLDLDTLDFSPKSILMSVVEKAFPTKRFTEELDPVSGKTVKVAVIDKDGNHLESQQALMMRDSLLHELNEKVNLPENPLDQIVNYFGENAVAEITGRKRRIITDSETGEKQYVKRAREGVAMDKASQDEMLAFQAGRKRIGIISQSASTGISLHSELEPLLKEYVAQGKMTKDEASNILSYWKENLDAEGTLKLVDETENDLFRRVHITLETSWSADTQMQTFGRTHRSNQLFPPEYLLVSTNLGGEKRFLSTIAKRLSSLGALTKGDREQAGGGNLLQYDFENKYGVEAAKKIVGMLRDDTAVLMTLIPADPVSGEERSGLRMLYTMGLAKREGNGYVVSEKTMETLEVSRFLNRVLMLDVDTQNAVFDAFTSEMEAIINNDKENGTFDEGVRDIEGENIRFAAEPHIVSTDQATGANTYHYQINADTPNYPVTLEELKNRNEVTRINGIEIVENKNKGIFYQQINSKNIIYVEYKASRVEADTGKMRQYFGYARPSGWQSDLMMDTELSEKYVPVELEQQRTFKDDVQMSVKDWWKTEEAKTPKTHVNTYHLITGAVLPVWQRLSSSDEAGYQTSLKTVRIETAEGERIVGVHIPGSRINRVLRDLGVERSFKTPEEIFKAVIETKDTVELVGGIKLHPTFLKRKPIIQIMNLSFYQQKEFGNYGALQERPGFEILYFVPNDEEKGIEVLTKILERYPAVDVDDKPSKVKNTETSFTDKLKEKINQLQNNGLGDGILAKFADKNTPFAVKAEILANQPISSYWWMMKAETTAKGQVLLNAASYEFVRATYKEAMGIRVEHFEGLFNDPLVSERFFEALDRKTATGGIYAEAIASLTKTMANARNSREDGILILLTDETASMHEELHVSSFVASAGKTLEERHARFDELRTSEAYLLAKTSLMNIHKTDSDGLLVEECFVYCASGDADKLGLLPNEAAEFTELWFKSFAEKNGIITKEQFKELTNESQQIRDRAYREIGAEIIRRKLGGEGIETAGRTLGDVYQRDIEGGSDQAKSKEREVDQLQIINSQEVKEIIAEEKFNRAIRKKNEIILQPLYKPSDEDKDTTATSESGLADKEEIAEIFESIFKDGGIEKILESKDGLVKFETPGRNPTKYQIEFSPAEIKFTEFETTFGRETTNIPNRGLYFTRNENGNFRYSASFDRKNSETLLDPVHDEIAGYSEVSLLKSENLGKNLIITELDAESEIIAVVEEANNRTIARLHGAYLGKEIIGNAKYNEAEFNLARFERELKDRKFTVTIEEKNIEEKDSQEKSEAVKPRSISLADLERERIAYAKTEVKESKKTGIMALIAEDKQKPIEQVEKQSFDKAVRIAEEEQAPWITAITVEANKTRAVLQENLRQSGLHRADITAEVNAVKKQSAQVNIKPILPIEQVWSEQIKAAQRGDVEIFKILEEIHLEKQVPRPNDVYARLRGVESLTGLTARQEEKNLSDWIGAEKTGDKTIVVEIKKENSELKVENFRIEDVKVRHAELVAEFNESKKEAESEHKQANREALQPLLNKINPLSPLQGKLSWFTKPVQTLNAHINPIEIIKNDPGVQIVRAVYKYFDHKINAKALEMSAREAFKQATMLKEQYATEIVKNSDKMAESVAQAVKNEEMLRTELRQNPMSDVELLKTPERALTDAEMKSIGETSAKLGDSELLKNYLDVVKSDTALAEAIGETGEQVVAKSMLAEARAAYKSSQAIEQIAIGENGALEVAINPRLMVEAEKFVRTGEVIEEFMKTEAIAKNSVPRLSLEQTGEAEVLINPLTSQAELTDFINSEIEKTGTEFAKLMENPMTETEQELLKKMSLPKETLNRFEQIRESELTVEELYNQADLAFKNNIPFQNTGQTFTITNPGEITELEARQFWKDDRDLREKQLGQEKQQTRLNDEADTLTDTEALEAVETAEELEAVEIALTLG